MDNSVIEAVDRVSVGGRPPIEYVEQLLIMGGGQALHFDPDISISHQLEDLGQQRQLLTVSNAGLPSLDQGKLGDGPVPRDIRVVMHHYTPVPSRVNVQLDAIGIERDGPPEGGSRVLVFVT
jgi:hypothetical protein